MVHRKGVEGSEGPGQGVWPTVGQREARSGEDMDAAGGLHPAFENSIVKIPKACPALRISKG